MKNIILNLTPAMQATTGGIEVRCLLNPKIKPGTRIKIDQASIQTQQLSTNYSAGGQNALIPGLDADGTYKVLKVTHHGDTRGTDWYSDLICLAMSGSTIPTSLSGTLLNVNP